jgi:hypothetical protein
MRSWLTFRAHADHGGDSDARDLYQEEGPEKSSRGTLDVDLLEYVTWAQMG